MIFHLKATIWKLFDIIIHLKETQNLIAEHYERDFDMIFHFNAAKNFVAEHDERDFELIF